MNQTQYVDLSGHIADAAQAAFTASINAGDTKAKSFYAEADALIEQASALIKKAYQLEIARENAMTTAAINPYTALLNAPRVEGALLYEGAATRIRACGEHFEVEFKATGVTVVEPFNFAVLLAGGHSFAEAEVILSQRG